MPDVQLASFVNGEADLFASIIALKSLSNLKLDIPTPIVVIPRPLVAEIEGKFPDLKIKPIYRKLGAKLEEAFANGYNSNLGFRPAVSKVMRRGSGKAGVLFFSPHTVFFDGDFIKLAQDKPWAASQPDDFWPQSELYGPSLTQMWTTVVQLGGGKLEDWTDIEMPKEYWRHYPAASPALFYAPDPAAFESTFGAINDVLIKALPPELDGQGHVPPEACLTATIVKLNGEIIDPLWDINLQYYQDFYDLILRMNDDQWASFNNNVLETSPVRGMLKSVEEYKLIFYQNRMTRIRENLDDVESNFSILRMQELITRRKIRKNVKKRIKENTPLPLI